jgi:tRNA threonylcarbamoyladenosine biosynthesis protein TsaB
MNIVLSIETSVQGGSISLLENKREIGSWQGIGKVTESADILDELSNLLKETKLKKPQIKKIVISKGPGSFTGTRIGMAIAQGLKKSLSCDVCGVSVLEAMALESDWNNSVMTAIPIGTKICIQNFKVGEKGELKKITMPFLISFKSLVHQIENNLDIKVMLYGKLYKDMSAIFYTNNEIIERLKFVGENLAFLIGRLAKEFTSDNPHPIYLNNTK